MKLVSIRSLFHAARRVFLRFPATILSSVVAAWVAIVMVGLDSVPDEWIHLLMIAALGIPLFTALQLLWEKPPRGRPWPRRWIGMAGGALFLVLYWLVLEREPGDSRNLRYFQISLAFHLAVAVAPFLGRGARNGFWQFNRRLFLRFILSAIYATVFFGGLSLALVAVDQLFELKIKEEIYGRLWLFTVFVFQTWHFLGGVPENLADLDADREHPKALRIFSQYMLVPLVVLYVLILYAYMGKVLLTREWPQGWVGWLVSFAAVFGMLTLLLLDPSRQEQENRWMDLFGRSFYVAILPLLGLLFVALAKRVGQYGMTERRYFLLILGLWLAAIALYMILSAAKSIKVVPLTLGLTALVTAFGPWGAYRISLHSQSRRLESLLRKYDLLSRGKIVPSTRPVPREDLVAIGATVDYLIANHGAGQLNRWSDRDWEILARQGGRFDLTARVGGQFLAAMKLEHLSDWRAGSVYAYYRAREEALDVGGYDWLVPINFRSDSSSGNSGYSARLAEHGRTVEILNGSTVVLKGPLEPILLRLPQKAQFQQPVPADDLSLVTANESLRARVCFTYLTLQTTADGTSSIESGSGYLLIDTKP